MLSRLSNLYHSHSWSAKRVFGGKYVEKYKMNCSGLKQSKVRVIINVGVISTVFLKYPLELKKNSVRTEKKIQL